MFEWYKDRQWWKGFKKAEQDTLEVSWEHALDVWMGSSISHSSEYSKGYFDYLEYNSTVLKKMEIFIGE